MFTTKSTKKQEVVKDREKERNREGGALKMPLTKEFKETVMLRAKQDPDFRKELIVEENVSFVIS